MTSGERLTFPRFKTALVDGALAWTAYAAAEVLLAGPVIWLASNRLEYRPTAVSFSALTLLLYPLLGAVAGGLVWLLTRGRLVRTAGLVVLPVGLAVSAAWTRIFVSWTWPMFALGVVVALLVVGGELWPRQLGWAANAWWVAAVVAGTPFLEHEIGVWFTRLVRVELTAGFPLAATLINLALWRRYREPWRMGRRAGVAGALAVVALLLAFVPHQAVRDLPVTAKTNPGRRPNVLLITLDTTRADHLSLYGYHRDTTPNLDRMAASSTVYEHAVAPSEMTLPSHASIFTGLYATRNGAHFSKQYPFGRPLETKYPTLAEILRNHGYYTAAVAANTIYLRHVFRLDRGFLYWDNRWAKDFFVEMAGAWLRQATIRTIEWVDPRQYYGHGYRQAETITDEAEKVLDRARGEGRPFFLFLNYMDAHFPCVPPARYRDAFPGRDPHFTMAHYLEMKQDVLRLKREVTPAELRHLQSQYDGAMLYMDAQLERLFDYMRRTGIYDNTLIIVTSDHGEAQGERHYMEHASMAVYQFLVGVPLLIRYPDAAHRGKVEQPVSLVDLLPTALDVTGYPAPTPLDGYSLLRPAPAGAKVIAEMFPGVNAVRYNVRYGRHQRAYYSGAMKFIQATDGTRELYNVDTDPHELHNLYASEPAVATPLAAALDGWLAQYLPRENAATPARRGQYENVDQLRSLGYVQ